MIGFLVISNNLLLFGRTSVPRPACPTIIEITTLPAHCGMADAQITINATSLLGPLTYSIDGSTFQDSAMFADLPSGLYHVFVSDTGGCVTEDSVFVDDIPAVKILSLVPQNAYCDEDNGNILTIVEQLDIMGYSLDKIHYTGSPMFSNLAPGDYTVYLKSYNGCLDSASTTIIQLGTPVFDSIQVSDADCNNMNGRISVQASGGIGNLSFSLSGSPADTAHVFHDLTSGGYLLSVIDELGCMKDTSVFITRVDGIHIEHLKTTPSDCGMSNGSIDVMANGLILEYLLNGTTTSASGGFVNLAAGVHTLRISDDMGCTLNTLIEIRSKDCNVFLPNIFSPNGDGINDVFGPVTADTEVLVQSFEIFSRWGSLVYSCNSGTGCFWDGTNRGRFAEAGAYFFRLTYLSLDGEVQHKAGSVTLVR